MRAQVGGLFLIRRQRCDSGYNHTSSSGCREKRPHSVTGRRYSRRAPSDTAGRRDVPYGCTRKTMSGADYRCKVHSTSCWSHHQHNCEKSGSGRMARILANNAANRPVSFVVTCSRGIVQGGEVLLACLAMRNLLIATQASSQASSHRTRLRSSDCASAMIREPLRHPSWTAHRAWKLHRT